jgi:hypothetical protein
MSKNLELELDGFIWRVLYHKAGIYSLIRKNENGINQGIIYNGKTQKSTKWF